MSMVFHRAPPFQHERHVRFDVGPLQYDVGEPRCERLAVGNEDGGAVGAALVAHPAAGEEAAVHDGVELGRAALRHAGHIGDDVLLHREHDAARIDAHDVVRDLLQVAGDVAGHEDAAALVAHVQAQRVERLLAGHRVEAGRGLVEHEQVGVVGQRACQRQLHAHAARQVLHRLVLGQLERVGERAERAGVPVLVALGHELAHRVHRELLGERARVEHHADALLELGEALFRRAETSRRRARWSRRRGG